MAYEDLTVPELKDLLRERGLPLSGKKADLIAPEQTTSIAQPGRTVLATLAVLTARST